MGVRGGTGAAVSTEADRGMGAMGVARATRVRGGSVRHMALQTQ